MTPANLRNLLLNTLSRYRYRVMSATDGGLDVCRDDPAIQQLVVVARHCRLQRVPITSTAHGEHEGSTHLRLRQIPALLSTVAGPIGCFPWATFRHVYGTPGQRDPMMSSFQPASGKKREKTERHTNLPASTRFRIDLASSSCLSSAMRPSARGSLVCIMTPSRASKCCMRCSMALI